MFADASDDADVYLISAIGVIILQSVKSQKIKFQNRTSAIRIYTLPHPIASTSAIW